MAVSTLRFWLSLSSWRKARSASKPGNSQAGAGAGAAAGTGTSFSGAVFSRRIFGEGGLMRSRNSTRSGESDCVHRYRASSTVEASGSGNGVHGLTISKSRLVLSSSSRPGLLDRVPSNVP